MRESVSAFRSWKKTLLERLDQREQEVTTRLKELVPDTLTQLFDAESRLIPSIVESGRARRIICTGDEAKLECTSLNDLMGRIETLKSAWAGIVDISVNDTLLPHRIYVDFSATEQTLPPAHVDLGTTTVLIEFIFGDRIVRGELDAEESFMADLAHAVRDNGKDPADVIAFLADEGARYGKRDSIGWLNRVGR